MKTRFLIFAGFGLALTVAACSGGGNNESGDSTATDSAHAMAMDGDSTDTATYDAAHAAISGTKADTTVAGTAHFEKSGDKVKLTLNLEVPKKANSSVAVHFHEHGDCSDAGEGAHGHWNPTKENHGKWGSDQYHSGDIGNIELDKDGKATFTVETDRWTIGGAPETNILNRAVIVHSGVDDYKSQPTGKSGSRIGCGVINKM
jgi:superoxide dismutase, Cu-Zn family